MENALGFGGGIYIPRLPTSETANTSIIYAQPTTVSLSASDSVFVRAGERVLVGTPIGIDRELTVYSSVSGVVRETENGRIIIENDTRNETAPPLDRPAGTPSELTEYMRKISLVGMGGAGFPTYRKYENTANIRFLLINACECEPHLSCDRALISNKPKLVIRGAMALASAIGEVSVFICVKHHDLLEALKSALTEENIRLVQVSKKFPQGSERQLISAVLRREVPRFRLPKDCGVIVSNCATAAAFSESLETGLPPVRRIVTVAGKAGKCANIHTPCGTSAQYLIDLCGGANDDCVVLSGGAMTGRPADPENTFVTLSTAGFTVLPKAYLNEKPCIHCGGCARVCPSRIVPYKIDAAQRARDIEEMKRLCADACISCGCCSYICPAKRELTEHTTAARRMIYAERNGKL